MRDFNQKGYKRITKTKARKLFYDGITIFVIPVNTRLSNPWLSSMPITNEKYNDFDCIVNSYEYYNCNNELGNYCAYYICEL